MDNGIVPENQLSSADTDGGRRRINFSQLIRPAAIILAAAVFALVVVTPVLASGDGHGEAAELKHVVDLEGKKGFNLFMARIYNNNRLLYALFVTAVMAVMGITVAKITGLVLRLFGIG